MFLSIDDYKKELLRKRILRQKSKLLKSLKIAVAVVVLSVLSLVFSILCGDGTLSVKVWYLSSQIILMAETAILTAIGVLFFLTDELNMNDVTNERVFVSKDSLVCHSNTYYRLLNESVSLPINKIRKAVLDEEDGECTFFGDFEYTFKDTGTKGTISTKKITHYTVYDCFDCDIEKVLVTLDIPCRIIRKTPTKFDIIRDKATEKFKALKINKSDLEEQETHAKNIDDELGKIKEAIEENSDSSVVVSKKEENGVLTIEKGVLAEAAIAQAEEEAIKDVVEQEEEDTVQYTDMTDEDVAECLEKTKELSKDFTDLVSEVKNKIKDSDIEEEEKTLLELEAIIDNTDTTENVECSITSEELAKEESDTDIVEEKSQTLEDTETVKEDTETIIENVEAETVKDKVKQDNTKEEK